MLSLLLKKSRSFLLLPRFTRYGLPACWVLLGLARLSVLVLPFVRMAPLLGHHQGLQAVTPLLSAEQTQRALAISRLIAVCARYTPWTSNCFPQAIVARLLLGFYGIPYVLYFGLARPEGGSGPLEAHAWVNAGRVAVSGSYSFNRFTVVGTFVSRDLLRECGPCKP